MSKENSTLLGLPVQLLTQIILTLNKSSKRASEREERAFKRLWWSISETPHLLGLSRTENSKK